MSGGNFSFKALLYLQALTIFMVISTDGVISHLKGEENVSLGAQRGKAKVTQPVSDGAGIPTRCVRRHLGGVCSLALYPREAFRDTEGSASCVRAQAPSHRKRLQATRELM